MQKVQYSSSSPGQGGESPAGQHATGGPCRRIWGQSHLRWTDGCFGKNSDRPTYPGTKGSCTGECGVLSLPKEDMAVEDEKGWEKKETDFLRHCL